MRTKIKMKHKKGIERKYRKRKKTERKNGRENRKYHWILIKKKEYKENRTKSERQGKEVLDRQV